MDVRAPVPAWAVAALGVALAGFSTLAPSFAAAQAVVAPPAVSLPSGPARRELGFAALVAEPVGELARYVGSGGGFRLFGTFRLDAAGTVGIRIEGTLISYGKTTEERALDLAAAPLLVDVVTENAIASFAAGPELSPGHGRVRPYATAMIGSSQFVTTTSVWAGGNSFPVASRNHLETHTFSWIAGGGVRIGLAEGRRRPVALELDGRYVHNGRTEYLREGGVRELPDGSLELDTVRSAANLTTLHLGIVIGFR